MTPPDEREMPERIYCRDVYNYFTKTEPPFRHTVYIRADLAEKPAGGWQSMESAPKDKRILAWADGCSVTVIKWSYDAGKWINPQAREKQTVVFMPKYWMPLAAPPKGE